MAVYTEVSFEDLERLLQDYDIGTPLAFKGIAEGVENSNFYLQTDRGEYVLRRSGANPFSDPVLEDLVGKTISATGTIKEYVFFVDAWEVL